MKRIKWIALLAVFALLVAACGDDDDATETTEGTTATTAAPTTTEGGGLEGTRVTVFGPESSDEEAGAMQDALDVFAAESGIEIVYTGARDYSDQINAQAAGGNPPDIGVFPQPGKVLDFAREGYLLPIPDDVFATIDPQWGPGWMDFYNLDGVQYGLPNKSDLKSIVWYNSAIFEAGGYAVPETWAELLALTDQMIADGITPWCVGIESGPATGWSFTDWVEDLMLRINDENVYDQWIAHEIPFNGEEVLTVLNKVGTVLQNEDYVNGGFGNVQTIASTEFQDGGVPITEGNCYMHRQASFYRNFWPEGTNVAEDGDIWAFYFPTNEGATERPVLSGGEFVTLFDDRPEVQAFAYFMATEEYANIRAFVPGEAGGFISANAGLDSANLQNPLDQAMYEQFNDPEAVIRFDASDLMPAAVGSGQFWTSMTDWINGTVDEQGALDAIENAWPSS